MDCLVWFVVGVVRCLTFAQPPISCFFSFSPGGSESLSTLFLRLEATEKEREAVQKEFAEIDRQREQLRREEET